MGLDGGWRGYAAAQPLGVFTYASNDGGAPFLDSSPFVALSGMAEYHFLAIEAGALYRLSQAISLVPRLALRRSYLTIL